MNLFLDSHYHQKRLNLIEKVFKASFMTKVIYCALIPFFMMSVPEEDDDEYESEDWSDIDDEDFEDMAEDRNDFHEMQLSEGLTDDDDDDHFPEEE